MAYYEPALGPLRFTSARQFAMSVYARLVVLLDDSYYVVGNLFIRSASAVCVRRSGMPLPPHLQAAENSHGKQRSKTDVSPSPSEETVSDDQAVDEAPAASEPDPGEHSSP